MTTVGIKRVNNACRRATETAQDKMKNRTAMDTEVLKHYLSSLDVWCGSHVGRQVPVEPAVYN